MFPDKKYGVIPPETGTKLHEKTRIKKQKDEKQGIPSAIPHIFE